MDKHIAEITPELPLHTRVENQRRLHWGAFSRLETIMGAVFEFMVKIGGNLKDGNGNLDVLEKINIIIKK